METVRDFLFWLDAAPWRHWTVCWLLFTTTVALALAPNSRRAPSWALKSWLFAAAMVITLCAFRWPTWFYLRDLNPDEAQIVAGALTLDRFLLPWKHLDPTTHGPLCEYFLIFASWFGAPFNYVTARIMAALLQAGALLAVWATLRRLMEESPARIGVLSGLAFWCLTSWDDFLHYSSELPGIFLMAWSVAFLTRTLVVSGESLAHRSVFCFLAGAFLGAVPYAKLQSTPHAGVLGFLGLALVWRMANDSHTRMRLLAAILVGAITPTLLHGIYLTIFGLWNQFWYTYIVSAIDYMDTSAHRLEEMPARFLHFSATSPSFAWFLWGNLGFALLYLRSSQRNPPLKTAIILAWLSLAAAWFTVLRPGRLAEHYLHLLVIPLTTLVGLTLGLALGRNDLADSSSGRFRWSVLAAFTALGLLPQIWNHSIAYHRFVGHAQAHWQAAPSEPAVYIKDRSQPEDTLAMWGWAPFLLVETQLPHGTREAHSATQLIQWPLRRFFQDRYIGDLQRWRPVWFVDAVGPGAFVFETREHHSHETVPALQKWIAENYNFAAEIDHHRIYLSKGASRPMRDNSK